MGDFEKVLQMPTDGFHLYSAGCLDTYFRLREFLSKGKTYFVNDRILFLGGHTSSQNKTLVYEACDEDIEELKKLQHMSVIYSKQELPLEKSSAFEEIAYELGPLFDESLYKPKSFKSKIRYPLRWLENSGVTIRPFVEEDYEPVMSIFRKWADSKLNDPKVFKMMFPEKRYFRCIEACRPVKTSNSGFFKTKPDSTPSLYQGFVAEQDGKIQAFECLSVQDGHAFVLFRFGDPDCLSRLRFSVSIGIMKKLLEQGVQTCNVGVPLPGGLKQFKERLPFITKQAFKYSRIS